MKLIGDHHLDLATRRRRIQQGRAVWSGAEFPPPMHHGDLGDVLQRQRPIDRRIAPAGDHHALAAEILPAANVILDGARRLVGRKAGERRAVRAERAGAGGDQHGFGGDRVAQVGGQPEIARCAGQRLHAPAEQSARVKRSDLAFQRGNQLSGVDRRMGGDVVDRLFRIQRGALAAGFRQGVYQHAGQFQHAQFEHGEQADRAGADDRYVGGEVFGHGAA